MPRAEQKDFSPCLKALSGTSSMLTRLLSESTRPMAKTLKVADIAPKRFEINQLFTPSTPVTVAELFAGRLDQIFRIIDTIAEPGRHAIIYGERGVGKTSMVQVVPYLVPDKVKRVRFCRVQAFPHSTFHSLFNAVFKKIKFTADLGDGQGEQEFSAAQTYASAITPDDVVSEFSNYTLNDIPIIVLDEFNEIDDPQTPVLVANTIKALSDAGTNVTVIIVGVADNVTQLIENHRIHPALRRANLNAAHGPG